MNSLVRKIGGGDGRKLHCIYFDGKKFLKQNPQDISKGNMRATVMRAFLLYDWEIQLKKFNNQWFFVFFSDKGSGLPCMHHGSNFQMFLT